jgi:hypothetical protein
MTAGARRAPFELAVDACTAMALATLAWCGLWTALSPGWRPIAAVGGWAAITVVIDRLLRVVMGSPSAGVRVVAGLLLVTAVAMASIGGPALFEVLRR